MTTARKPSFIAYAVNGEGKQAFWTSIRTAWPQASGDGFNIDLAALPINGRIILMLPKADAAEITS